jgi:hypothetical protein
MARELFPACEYSTKNPALPRSTDLTGLYDFSCLLRTSRIPAAARRENAKSIMAPLIGKACILERRHRSASSGRPRYPHPQLIPAEDPKPERRSDHQSLPQPGIKPVRDRYHQDDDGTHDDHNGIKSGQQPDPVGR